MNCLICGRHAGYNKEVFCSEACERHYRADPYKVIVQFPCSNCKIMTDWEVYLQDFYTAQEPRLCPECYYQDWKKRNESARP